VPIVPSTPDRIAEAARYLRQGGLVAFPTETVYGLGADATNDLAVAALFSAKGRPTFNPLIVHVPNLTVAERFAVFDDRARELTRQFWPGPLTLVVPKREGAPISELATAGLGTVAMRCPAHPVALRLIAEARTPLAAPSANKSGRVSPTTAAHVAADFGDTIEFVLDGGPTEVGLESTILDLSNATPRLLRPGVATREEIEAAVGTSVHVDGVTDPARPTAPGQLASHYAPRAAVRLAASDVRADEALLAFGPATLQSAVATINLSTTGDLIEAAAHLFAALRTLDASGAKSIAVMPIPDTGIGRAINDRLVRAAAPRPSGTIEFEP
jgi:L-threonylcarbamoyladenylate synthase